MTILTPTAADEGTSETITGTSLDLVAPVDLTANGFLLSQVVTGARTTTDIPIDIDSGLTSVINAPLLAHSGVPLTDSNRDLKWVVGADELAVTVSPPANYQQREIANSEKLGGWLEGINFGEQDQQFGLITTGTNTVSHTESNGKATGFLVGVNRVMDETIKNYFFTAQDGRYRAMNVVIIPFSAGDEFTEEFGPEFT